MSGANTGLNLDIIKKYQGIASKGIVNAVAKASQKTGVDFSFLMEKASTESSFNPNAKSKTSSATGLFQFIESTWLTMVKEHGAKYGLQNLADHIEIKNGKPCVDNCQIKQQILNLRKNPEISALMAGEFSSANKDYLQAHTDGAVGSTELYMAHFMGAQSAAKFLNAQQSTPQASAAHLFPQAARANHSVFYTSSGHARSLQDVYNLFDKKFSDSDHETAAPTSHITQTAGFIPSSDSKASASIPTTDFLPSESAMTQALPSFSDDADNTKRKKKDDIIWSDDPRYAQFTRQLNTVTAAHTGNRLSPVSIVTLAEMATPPAAYLNHAHSAHGYNS